MSSKHDLNVVVTLSDNEFELTDSTQEEVINAINSVPSIRAKERIIKNLPNSARLIKALPVLTEGTYNGMFYPDDVLQRDAKSWVEHDKPGMTLKVKLEHKGGVIDRAGHIIDSYYDDKFIKQDILLLNEEAINLWDQGFLDDVSIRAGAQVDMENSTSKRIVVKRLKARGTDFVDNPACKTCGLDVLLEELTERENIELEDKDMSEKKKEKEGMKAILVELAEKFGISFKDEDVEAELEDTEEVEETVEEEVEETSEEEQDEESEEEDSEEEDEEESEEELSDEGVSMTDKELIEARLEEAEKKYKAELEVRLSKIEKKHEGKIKELEAELAESETKKAEKARKELVAKLQEVSGKFKVELSEEQIVELSDLEKTEDATITAQIGVYEAILHKVPEGELPKILDVTLEDQNEKIDEEIVELEEKGKNLYMG